MSFLITPALLIAYLVGSLVFTGAQVVESGTPVWRPIVDWPVFTVTPWITVPLAVAGLVASFGLIAVVTIARSTALTTVFGWVMAAGLSSWVLAVGLPPASLGLEPLVGSSDHYVALAINSGSAFVVLIRIASVVRSHERLQSNRLIAYPTQLLPPQGLDRTAPFTIEAPVDWRVIGSELLPPRCERAGDSPLSISLNPVPASFPTSGAPIGTVGGHPMWRLEHPRHSDAVRLSYLISHNGSRSRVAQLEAVVSPSLLRGQAEVDTVIATADIIAGTFRWR